MSKLRAAVLIVIAAVVGFGAGRYWEPTPPLAVAIPTWVPQRKDPTVCLPPDEQEQRVFDTAVTVLELNKGTWIGIGAQKFLSHGLYRKQDEDYVPVCPPPDIYPRTEKVLTTTNGFMGFLDEYQLVLAGRLHDPSDYIVERIAAVAFEDKPHIRQEQHNRPLDLRPLARTVLASYGRRAEAYRDRAFQELSTGDSLGIGAAQIAASTGHPAALGRVKNQMEEVLASIPAGESIGLEQRDRLYELAYAMYFAGAEAQPYAAPIKELMTRKVIFRENSFFGPFSRSPKQMCHVLDKIFGKEQSPSRTHQFCNDEKYPYP